jgi:hypothetical protein
MTKLINIKIVFSLLTLIILIYFATPLVALWLPLSKLKQKEIVDLDEKLKTCEGRSQKHILKEFQYIAYATYIDDWNMYSFSERWDSLEGLPLNIRIAGAIFMIGRTHSNLLYFDSFGIRHFQFFQCFLTGQKPNLMHWEKGETIVIF